MGTGSLFCTCSSKREKGGEGGRGGNDVYQSIKERTKTRKASTRQGKSPSFLFSSVFLSLMSSLGTLALFSPLAVLFRIWANIFDTISYLYIYIVFESSMRDGRARNRTLVFYVMLGELCVVCPCHASIYYKYAINLSLFSDAFKSLWLNALNFQWTF